MKFEEKSACLFLEIEKEKIDFLDSQIQYQEKIFCPKSELHITIINPRLANKIKKTAAQKPEIMEQIKNLAQKTDWTFHSSGSMFHVAKTKQREVAKGEFVDVHAESIVLLVEVPAIEDFFRQVEQIIGETLPVPPLHITLYTYGDKSGIGLTTTEDFSQWVTGEVSRFQLIKTE